MNSTGRTNRLATQQTPRPYEININSKESSVLSPPTMVDVLKSAIAEN